MGEKYFPFMSVNGDRKYTADDWARYFAQLIGNGVFYSNSDRLKVVPYEGMKVKIKAGFAFVNGRMYELDADKIITLDTADGALNRIDRIAVRCNHTDRKITAVYVKGAYSERPTAPGYIRNADTYDLVAGDIAVNAGVVNITAANITDQRLNTTLCGIVTGLVQQADTTAIFNQFTTYLNEFKEDSNDEFEAWFNGVIAEWTREFNDWFLTIQNQLSEDAAGALQNQINDLTERVTALEYMTIRNDYSAPILLDNSGNILVDNDGAIIVANWKHKEY